MSDERPAESGVEDPDVRLLKDACDRVRAGVLTVSALQLEGEMCWAIEFLRAGRIAGLPDTIRLTMALAGAAEVMRRDAA